MEICGIEEAIEILKEFKKTGFHTLMIKYNEDRIHTNKIIEQAIETLLTVYEEKCKELKKEIQDDLDVRNRWGLTLQELEKEKEKNKSLEQENSFLKMMYRGTDEFKAIENLAKGE